MRWQAYVIITLLLHSGHTMEFTTSLAVLMMHCGISTIQLAIQKSTHVYVFDSILVQKHHMVMSYDYHHIISDNHMHTHKTMTGMWQVTATTHNMISSGECNDDFKKKNTT